MKAQNHLIGYVISLIVLSQSGCDDYGSSGSSGGSSTQPPESQSVSLRAQSGIKLTALEQEIGITFPSGSRLIFEGNGGSDGVEYYEWLIASPSNFTFTSPFSRELEHDDVSTTVQLIDNRLETANATSEDRLSGKPIKSAFSVRNTSLYQYRVEKLSFNSGGCYSLVMRHKQRGVISTTQPSSSEK